MALRRGSRSPSELYFAQIVAWIVQKAFPRASIAHVVVEEVKRVSRHGGDRTAGLVWNV
jgi:hypothetical protein